MNEKLEPEKKQAWDLPWDLPEADPYGDLVSAMRRAEDDHVHEVATRMAEQWSETLQILAKDD